MLTWGGLLTPRGIGAWKISVGRGLPIAITPVVAFLRLSVIADAEDSAAAQIVLVWDMEGRDRYDEFSMPVFRLMEYPTYASLSSDRH